MRIRPLTLAGPQISASIPSETDYRGLSQTHGIITGSPLGHCSLHAPQMEKTHQCCAVCQSGSTVRKHRLISTKKTAENNFSRSVCCCSLQFPHQNSLISPLPPVFSVSGLPLCLRHDLSLTPNFPPAQFSGAPILYIAQVSFFFSFFNPLLLFPTLCVSTTSPPCGQFINDTVETEGIKTSQTHLPYGPQK